MGPSRYLVNLDKRQSFLFVWDGHSTFNIHNHLAGRTFKVYTAAEYIERRRERITPSQYPVAFIWRRIAQRQSPLLAKLPVEAISLCVAFADSLWDKACFGLTCQDAWDIARLEIIKDLHAREGWAGDRIIILGGSMRLDDVPPNVLNDDELATVRDMQTDQHDGSPANENPSWTDLVRARDFDRFEGTELLPNLAKDIGNWLYEVDREDCIPRSKADRRWFPWNRDSDHWQGMVCERASLATRGSVLRNLTTHEYIRGDAYLEAREEVTDHRTPIWLWSLGEILLLRISWARDRLWDAQGAWAGHRFDFVSEDELPCDEEGEVLPPWKDVSEELIDELLGCRNMFGC